MKREIPEGMTVRVSHLRRFPGVSGYISKRAMHGAIPESKGGMTIASVWEDGVLMAGGFARCSIMDNYSKRIGRDIALGRALKQLEG